MSRVQPLVLRAGDEQVLAGLTRSSTIAAGLAQRARILLLAAEDESNVEIARRVGVSLPTVTAWRVRYADGGLDALGDRPRSGRPAVHDQTSIIAATLDPPPDKLGVTHWSARLLADHLGISFATVARIWRRWGLQPWKAETFTFSTDPELEVKIRDVVGLYLDPPEKAVVLCVDEETQIQALDRTAPILPLRPGDPGETDVGGQAERDDQPVRGVGDRDREGDRPLLRPAHEHRVPGLPQHRGPGLPAGPVARGLRQLRHA